MREIEFIIDKDGKITIDQINFAGPECAKFAEEFAKDLGVTLSHKNKSDYFQSSVDVTPKVPITN